jgi:hypothetical protein
VLLLCLFHDPQYLCCRDIVTATGDVRCHLSGGCPRITAPGVLTVQQCPREGGTLQVGT